MTPNTHLPLYWPVFMMQGVAALIFSAVTWLLPQATLGALIAIFAAFFMFDGVSRVWLALKQKDSSPYWYLTLIAGALGIIAAIVTVAMPQLTAMVMLYLIAFWAVAIGVMEIVAAIKLSKYLDGTMLVLISGIISVVFGGYLMFNPGQGILAVLWLVAIYAFIFGIILCWLGFKMRSLQKQGESG
ncbi:HdeD family acid-resistance protein [Pseudoalteromonas sp. SSDWG2]|uniref:HdeD family acid-resistance protein n=1 Tax=Pseudoalteromonas sp. SSDWG2 TaxID=3139391 RepID=UPI003BA843AB